MSPQKILAQKTNVIMQFHDGEIMTIEAMATEIRSWADIDFHEVLGSAAVIPVHRRSNYEIHLVGIGEMTTSYQETVDTLRELRSAMEWSCVYCGRPNQRIDEICKSCGAVRWFLYGP